jgi:hypothetical protein
MPRLLIKSSGASSQWIELKAGLNRLGRSPANDIQIHAATVSARHCEISVVDDGVTVRDCGSTNGIFIDHHPVSEAILLAGQVLQVGEIELVLDATPVVVAIPRLDNGVPTGPSLLPDGSLTCLNHPASRAAYRCTQCQKVFCPGCVHQVRRVGGTALKLCPRCSGRCEVIPGKAPTKRPKKSVMGVLEKTLKLALKRKR